MAEIIEGLRWVSFIVSKHTKGDCFLDKIPSSDAFANVVSIASESCTKIGLN